MKRVDGWKGYGFCDAALKIEAFWRLFGRDGEF
jgi:hypothetical protein